MRRPLTVELSTDERSLARRWLLAGGSIYSIIVISIVGLMMILSGADKATVTAISAGKEFSKELSSHRSPMRPYGSLPDTVQSIAACTASRVCPALGGAGARRPE